MRMSDLVARYITEMLDEQGGNAEIQRNELAGTLGCVPSQINYVITSRFTPEQGYIVESRRGGGGYIRITRISMDRDTAVMHIVNSIGARLDGATANAIIKNMAEQNIIDAKTERLMMAALSDRCFTGIASDIRDSIRAMMFKNMMLTL